MDIVKFGIIGIGNMGSNHVVSVTKVPQAKLTSVCDINPRAFDRIAPEIRAGIRCFTSPDEFFKEADVDAVIIAVPHYSHPDLAIAAMQAGKHVLLEKPIAVHKAEAERLLAEAAKHPDLVKSLMFNQRTLPAHRKIKQMIDTGELGKINRVNWIITDWFRSQHYYDSGDWRASWRGEGGGVLLNQCPHQLDLWQWFFGLPVRVRAEVKFGKYHDIEVEDEVNAYLEYADGKTGNFIASTGEMPGTNRLEITAERGRLVFELGNLEFIRNEIETTHYSKTTEKSFAICDNWKCEIGYDRTPPDFQHLNVIRNVAAAILGQAQLIAPMEEGIRGLELGNAMLLSGLTGADVRLPLDSAEFARHLQKLIDSSRYQKKSVVSAPGADDFAGSF